MCKRILDHPYVLSCILVAVFMGTIALLYGIVFDTVDDYNIMMTLAGEKTGEPYYELTFYSVSLSFLISLLYRITDAVQWYSVIELAMIYSSLVVILARIIISLRQSKVPILIWLVIIAVFFVIFFMYPVQRMQFTATAALLGTAACAIVCTLDVPKGADKGFLRDLLVSALFITLCFAERLSAGYCLLVFWILLLARLWLSIEKDTRKQLAKPLVGAALAGIVACASIYIIDSTVRATGDNADYVEYNKQRAAFQDYPKPIYQDAKELYESIGWSENIYRIASSLSFLDPAINEENLKKIVESEEYSEVQPGISGAVKLGARLITSNDAAKAAVLGLAGLLAACLFFAYKLGKTDRKKAKQVTAQALLFLLVGIALGFYLCIEGRFPLRSFQCFAFPLSIILLTLFIQLSKESAVNEGAVEANANKGGASLKGNSSSESYSTPVLLGALILALCLGAGCYLSQAYVKELHIKRDASSMARIAAIEEYAISNPDKIFVHDFSLASGSSAYDPFRTHSQKPTNLIISGGSYTYTGAYYDQLQENGLPTLFGSDLLRDNVYLISKSKSNNQQFIIDYMKEKYGPITAEEVDKPVKNVSVYKFKRGEENPEATEGEEAVEATEAPAPADQGSEGAADTATGTDGADGTAEASDSQAGADEAEGSMEPDGSEDALTGSGTETNQ